MTDNDQIISEYPLANTAAARLLSKAFVRIQREDGVSQRQLAKELNYKSSVVLSHMALGRVPIPIDRAIDLARLLKIDCSEFLMAVLNQRHPDIDFKRVFGVSRDNITNNDASAKSYVVEDLETLAGCKMDNLPVEKLTIVREVLSDANPSARWMTNAERPVLDIFRKADTGIRKHGLQTHIRKRLEIFIRDNF